MTHKKISLALLAVAAAAALAWGVLGRSATQGAAGGPAAKPVQTVSVVAAQLRDLPVSYEAAGTAVALNTVEIRPQLSSTVRQVAIQEGQNVARGQLLFTFDDRNERANLDKARAQLARDRATLADLQRQLRRAQDLKAQNFVADNAVDTVQSQVDAQQATLQSDAAALAAAEVALSYTSVRAPLAGRAGAINVYPGSLVQPSGAALVTISQMDPIGVSFNLPEAELAGVLAARGQTVKLNVRLPGTPRGTGASSAPAASAAAPASASGAAPAAAGWDGVLHFIDNTVDATTGTVKLKGSVANAHQTLWPGQYVQVRLTLRTLKDAVVIPQAALIQRGAERLVYVVDAQSLAQARPVKVRYSQGELAAVEGLSAGESVVLEGKQNLRPGAAVRVERPAGKPAATSGAPAASASAASTVVAR